jgi:diguanylate cyclase (GGDEF)-like protein
MDCMMPGMSGFEACEQLQLLPEEQRMPIIMVTGLADDTSIRQAIQAGAADFITKPVQIPLLCQRVKRLLEVKQTRERIRHLAYHDTLTGLPNRALFNDRLQLAISAAKRDHHRLAMLFLNLDNFKTINDGLGHAVGDLLLRAVAERLSANVREGDTLSRVGSDEFALLLPKLTKGDEAVHGVRMIAEKMIDCMKLPFSLDGQEVYIGISIGISICPEDGEDGATLLKNAGSAMHWAKATGRNSFSLYAGAMNAEVTERLQLENGLRKAMERNELVIYYQPQVNVHAERTEGMEALLRWQHPELGLVAPYKFIPLAEETGLIVEIGAWVLRMACAQCKAWHERGHDRLVVAVNLSARQLVPGDLVDVVRAALEESGLPAWALDLEITESITMQGSSKAYDALHQLKALGVQISMDDFGTGYSSLSYLKRFPIDILKIDQSFVRDIMTDPSDATIVETIIAMADTLGMRVIAEGVETVEQLEFLRSHGCQIIQGYLVSRPLPAEDMDQFLARGRAALAW